MITELRRYRIRPERVESWVPFFAEAAAENERHGIRVEFAGVDPATTFYRVRALAAGRDPDGRVTTLPPERARAPRLSEPWFC